MGAQGVTDKSSRILDLACGPGNVAFILRDHGYTNIDGLDPSSGLLAAAQEKGLIAWNIADGYEGFNDFFLDYNVIYQQLIKEGKWAEVQPVKKLDNMLFDDAGYTYVMRKL